MYQNRVVVVNKGFEGLKFVKVGDFVISLRSFEGGIEYAYKVMADYTEKALSILKEISSGELQESLQAYVDFVVARNK